MKIWNFGIVGTGVIADFHARAIADLPNAKLTACCNRTFAKAEAFAAKHNCSAYQSHEELLADESVDVISICTASGLHMEPAVAAAEAGKQVICEKPLDITLERVDAMIAAHEKAGTRLGGIFNYRFCDMMTPVREAIRAGRLGRITCASVFVPWWRPDTYYTDSWHGTLALDGGGALMNQSIHMIDTLCELMPRIESVQAFTTALAHPQIEAEDTAAAVLRFSNGALGVIYGATSSYPGRYRRCEITGTQGTIVTVEDSIAEWQFATPQPEDEAIRQRFGQIQSSGGGADPTAIPYENHTRNFAAFIKALEGDTSTWISGQEARKAVEVVLAIYTSAGEERIVKL